MADLEGIQTAKNHQQLYLTKAIQKVFRELHSGLTLSDRLTFFFYSYF